MCYLNITKILIEKLFITLNRNRFDSIIHYYELPKIILVYLLDKNYFYAYTCMYFI